MVPVIVKNIDQIKLFCAEFSVAELYLFGSALTDDFDETSDLDFAVLFKDNLSPLEHGDAFFALHENLQQLLNRKVDLVSYRVVKNPIFKKELDNTKVSIYAAA